MDFENRRVKEAHLGRKSFSTIYNSLQFYIWSITRNARDIFYHMCNEQLLQPAAFMVSVVLRSIHFFVPFSNTCGSLRKRDGRFELTMLLSSPRTSSTGEISDWLHKKDI